MGEQRGILIADDNVSVLDGYRRYFGGHGFVVHTATTGAATKRLHERNRPDIVLVDLRLGNDWGIDVIRDLKASCAETRAFMMSGYLSVAATAEAMRAGAEHVFFKPFNAAEFLRVIDGSHTELAGIDARPPTLARAAFEHVSRVLADAGGNVSEAARRLGIHRQTLQRHLRNVPRA